MSVAQTVIMAPHASRLQEPFCDEPLPTLLMDVDSIAGNLPRLEVRDADETDEMTVASFFCVKEDEDSPVAREPLKEVLTLLTLP
jgi:hypothetical protein